MEEDRRGGKTCDDRRAENLRQCDVSPLHRLDRPKDVKPHHHLVRGELCVCQGDEPIQFLRRNVGPPGRTHVFETQREDIHFVAPVAPMPRLVQETW
jgi:hypothetical protein